MIVATDLDGTLTGASEHITPGNADALSIARARGVPCVLATARPSRCVDAELDRLDLFDAVITCNGAERVTPHGATMLAPLHRTHIVAVAAVLRRHAIAGSFAFEYGGILGHEAGYRGWPATDTGTEVVVDSFAALRTRGECARLLFRPDEAERDGVVALLESEFGRELTVTDADSAGRRCLVEISSSAATKGNALMGWLKETKREHEELVAFGDQLNDLSMLRIADRAFAVGHAHPGIAMRFPSLPNDDGTGVGRCLLGGLLPSSPTPSSRKEAHVQ